MSGHSKWATIKRQKGANDQKRGQLFTKLGREIAVAVRAGGPDPEANFRLRLAIQKARAENMPKDNIDRAIERASGAGNTDNFDEVSYEGYGPGGVAVVIQALTDNRNRTVGEVRSALTRAGGSLGESGSVAWMFDNVGLISVEADGQDPEEIALVAIDAGAEDVSIDDDGIEVYTEVQNLHVVQDALVSAGINVNSADPVMKPKATVTPDSGAAIKIIKLLEKLEDLDDVQQVYSNLEFTDELLAEAS
ncbi:MAG: YebC/PmpR family DNA-binding transcriptional regulator [Thermomicrobiales bacterium]|nr:YebC/PmpR family DNA-binding transcriptional regulator [Thermomicrobiales bacterium]